jgi:tRNA threonylcarbamoyladenosine modification (KEOPS) complex  Pcc1 subunit
VYNTAATDALVLNGGSYQVHSAASALTSASLSAISLLAGSAETSDTLEVRAFNGLYWGDWTSLAVAVMASPAVAPVPAPPILTTQTAAQTWLGGRMVNLTLPAATFTDPQGQSLTYRATLSGGQALPRWLTFNPATQTFTGWAPTVPQTVIIVVQATDTSGLSATDTFTVTVLGPPVLTAPTSDQSWIAGTTVALTLPANAFTDPQGQALTYTATQSNGQALPSWLSFNAGTKTFIGTVPTTAQRLGITVTATDSSGLSAGENISVRVQEPIPPPRPGITVSAQTANQTWAAGQAVNLVLPANTFTDALGLKMTFRAYEVSGPNVTSWLHFRQATMEFHGTVPITASGMVRLEVVATDSRHMRASELFTVTLAAATGRAPAIPPPSSHGGASFHSIPPGVLLAIHA